MRAIAVAALTARMLAEAAARDGFERRRARSVRRSRHAARRVAVAFDRRARRVAHRRRRWLARCAGSAGAARPGAGLGRRRRLRRPPRTAGAAARRCCRCSARAAADVRRVRDPASFFGFLRLPRHRPSAGALRRARRRRRLAAQGCRRLRRLAHPAGAPTLRGDAASPLRYFQREVSGIADVGHLHRQRSRRRAARLQRADRAAARRAALRVLRRVRPGAGARSRGARSERGRARAGGRVRACAAWAAWTSCSTASVCGCSRSTRARRPAWRCTPMSAAPACCARTCAPACTTSCRRRRGRHRPRRRHRDRVRAARAAARRGGRRRARQRGPTCHDLPLRRHAHSPPAIRSAA